MLHDNTSATIKIEFPYQMEFEKFIEYLKKLEETKIIGELTDQDADDFFNDSYFQSATTVMQDL
jgi:hypothetical protein